MTAQEVTRPDGLQRQRHLYAPRPRRHRPDDEGTKAVRQALSLSDEWDKLGQGSLAMGCVVGRTQFH